MNSLTKIAAKVAEEINWTN